MKIPTLVGTTGLNGEDRVCIRECARSIPILLASNFSIGIHVIRRLLREAARALPDTFDVEIVEKHHRKKKDAPSGTALDMLADIGESGRNISATFGRHGRNERASGEVCIHSLRGGDVCGEHSVYFFGNGESIEIVHRAESREIFARGVLMAAEKFRGEKRPGLYGLSDVI
jgi:4-hydroxy-tetrahydrodipicolinate reductase